MATKPTDYTNRLINQTSPYLLQHAHNPVDWYPWSEEAFEKAKKEDKVVFLSIGYSACHWCHVMEKESFSDKRIAKILNEYFVSIKVDREERPDIDEVYMNAVQAMTGSGGWPLSVFLTPEGKPFYGGTYFPPTDLYGHPGFDRVLLAIAQEWKNNRTKLADSAGEIIETIASLSKQDESEALSLEVIKNANSYLKAIFDEVNGGFGPAPKFPQPGSLSMLLGYWHRTADQKSLEMVELTLAAMARGGMYDQLGGGFHRYSVDSQWLTTHFEKMLYDQASLSRVYIQAWQATSKEVYAKIAREIFDYVLRDMTDAGGGFYSAEDADSEGKEGAFYVWEQEGIKKILAPKNAEIFNEYYGVTKEGNFEDGKNILHVANSEETPRNIESILSEAHLALLEHRSKRPRPNRDDKIIAGWNGLMISSLAYGGAVLDENKYTDAAERCANFILDALICDGRLMRYYRSGKVVGPGFLDDYAFMAMGLIDLYQATFDARWLAEAKKLTQQTIELFDDEDGGFYTTGKDAERLFLRSKSAYDSGVPSGNSAAALVLLKLGRLTMEQRFTERAKRLLDAYSGQLVQSPIPLNAMLGALDFWIGPVQEIVIAGDICQEDTKEMLKLVRNTFLPNSVFLFHQTGPAGSDIEQIAPYIRQQRAVNSKATAYICNNHVCKQPITSIADLKLELGKISKQ
ncbi:MAG: thioredoxin domain-containing protein [Sedimentisphaerales bacterium]